ncbi:MAG: hypothetical protein A3I88_03710 [Candidatus Portnoybacteria bacterium RIFCSPLOWO2_12_FULL_39_9]|uniref:Uncharacterized protein n=1 Tax=Candidatus Portnoybacteria bacterium RIFCSPHIGHO2_12_FULL_38_9 TaxID=1801997 RepID=A0A1G2FFV8_9BACT|nr:MAG: hypothetical protein A3H00_00130 [Candidatus Portnoybacteria bacterium RBG_13_40_8]OGZ35431.1 MAG: hypothetical protein A2646_03690 [Candidatus Portnoybacteria bacterium RIFCSPHIGHO2_02_FULL_39_12]OGZ36964.1 MAG: hypothetical protein A3J64_03760 [Candidatus Portnoybacteria bacterium RIFCSPHIGHO2_12_FULL_38_9]OGZ37954.1 MAG: hypothetical protein A3F21_02070 [Candidatus Portnoybacteria bacterium RIFCSPLOWO2_01_FULL_38_39]OGZ39977.1 MAG: hypothetical protein A3I88_03710 [Candidatus Portnoy
MNQETLLKIVKTWNLNPKTEYREFRCANCQRYTHKAWHHWLFKRRYKTPVHFCNKCEKDFRLNKIKTNKPGTPVDKSKFNLNKFSENIKVKLIKITNNWNTKAKPIYKIFTCDDCGINMYKAYHIWFTLKGILIEAHLCKKCGKGVNL